MYYYCSRCGLVQSKMSYQEKICSHCKATLNPVPEKYISQNEILTDNELYTIEIVIQNEIVKNSPDFDQQLFNKLNDYRTKQRIESKRMSEILKQHSPETFGKSSTQASNIPKCPTCQSTNIRKMGGVERGASIWAFGLFSKNINKTFKCQNCGYTW